MSYTEEEKIKILYEKSLGDVRDLTNKMEAVANTITAAVNLISNEKTVLRAENEKLLVGAVKEIKDSVEQIAGVQANITSAAANAAREVLIGDDGPVNKLEYLVRQQHEALGWLNRAANYYEKSYVLWPMVLSSVFSALLGGLIVRFI